MSSKVFVIGTVFFSILVLVGSYFLIKGSSGNQAKKIVSYQGSVNEKPKAEAKVMSSDLGQIKVSEQKSTEFTLKNIGSKPLQLFNISSSCGCTVGQIIYKGKESQEFGMHSQSDYVDEIKPGDAAKVRVIYRPYVMPVYGVVDREVYISTNDPENPKLVFKVKAYVK